MSKSLALAFAEIANPAHSAELVAHAKSGGSLTNNQKTGRTGSEAMLIAHGDKSSRVKYGSDMYFQYLASGMYRPVVTDIVNNLVPKAQIDWIMASIPAKGPISKDTLVGLCRQVKMVYDAKVNKAGEPVTLKGIKADCMALVNLVVRQTAAKDTIEA